MMHDYYLKLLLEPEEKDKTVSFENWKRNDENEKKLKSKSEEEKYLIWQHEEIVGKKKREMVLSKDKVAQYFIPKPEDFRTLPQNSTLIKISFTLKKPYTSKDEGEFHLIDGRIFENPIVRDKFTGLPMVRPSTWKGHLRFAAEKVKRDNNKEEKKKIIRRLFGSEPEEKENPLKGRLYFFPTFFQQEDIARDVITPLKRDTRTPARGPITLEVIKPGQKGEFYLLYIPYPKGDDFKEEEVKEDLKFLAEALKLMFYVYGFSAKKTSGFGVIQENLKEGKIWIKSTKEIQEKKFSSLAELKNEIEKWVESNE